MLSERDVQLKFESAANTVEMAMGEVTIDRHVAEDEIRAKAFAEVLQIPYTPPKRRRRWISKGD